ncbi:putative phage associated membrane protein [Neisseria meningitidis alpha14]|uniref:Putative phage associated membrane protein n=1 Tax=Neisseria meningitidis (strain alpha14) TaxID=662598 RepID=C6S6T5_NEIML|nr:putative phage associated membrane protein [Neisseria meningitidis alpha14]
MTKRSFARTAFSLIAVEFDIQLDGDFSALTVQTFGFAVQNTGNINGIKTVFTRPLGSGFVLVFQPLLGFISSTLFHKKPLKTMKT